MAFCGTQMLVSLLVIVCAVIINGEMLTYKNNKVTVCPDDGYSACKTYRLKSYKRNGCLQKEAPTAETGLEYAENPTALYPVDTSEDQSGCCETMQLWTKYYSLTNTHNETCFIIQMPKIGFYQYTEVGVCGDTYCYSGSCEQEYTYVSLLAWCPKLGFCFYWFKVPAYCQCGGNY